jgi:hypothetical protein
VFAQRHQCHSERSEESGPAVRGGQIPRRCAPRNDTYGVALIVAFVVALPAAPCALAQTGPTELRPDWDRTIERGIEWCASVGVEPAGSLLLCTKDARVDLIDIETGRSRLTAAIPVQSGTRFAGAQREIAYGFGVSRIYALQVERSDKTKDLTPGLLWNVVGAPQEDTEGDPEFMTRIIAAQATPSGVLVVRSDGRVAELLAVDGRVRWQHRLPEIGQCRLHVQGTSAALFWKAACKLNVAFLDLQADEPEAKLVTVKGSPPIWTALVREKLVAVWPKQFGVISSDGSRRFQSLDPRCWATTQTVAVYVDPGPPAQEAQDSPASPLLLVGSDLICVYDLSSGVLRTPGECSLRTPIQPEEICLRLCLSGDLVLCTGMSSFRVAGMLPRIETLAQHKVAGLAIDVGVHRGCAYGLFWDMSDRFQSDSAEFRPRLVLVKTSMTPASAPSTAETRLSDVREFILEEGEAVVYPQTFWIGERLLIVDDRRMRAYTLP